MVSWGLYSPFDYIKFYCIDLYEFVQLSVTYPESDLLKKGKQRMEEMMKKQLSYKRMDGGAGGLRKAYHLAAIQKSYFQGGTMNKGVTYPFYYLDFYEVG